MSDVFKIVDAFHCSKCEIDFGLTESIVWSDINPRMPHHPDCMVLAEERMMARENVAAEAPNLIAEAKAVVFKALKDDPGFWQAYQANIAIRMYDMLHERGYEPKLKPEDRNAIADNLIELCFGP